MVSTLYMRFLQFVVDLSWHNLFHCHRIHLLVISVGMNEKMLARMGLPFTSVHVHPGSHAGYYPGAKR